MKRNSTKMMCAAFLPFALALLVPKMASATPVTVNPGQVVALTSLMTAGDVVLCDPGVAVCSASTPRAQIEGVASFYLSLIGPLTPDTGPDANVVTFLTAALLANFLNNYPGGFSSNAVFLDASANGMTHFGNFIFNDSDTSPTPTPTPEPSTLTLMGLGLLGVAALFRRQASSGLIRFCWELSIRPAPRKRIPIISRFTGEGRVDLPQNFTPQLFPRRKTPFAILFALFLKLEAANPRYSNPCYANPCQKVNLSLAIQTVGRWSL